LQTAVFPVLLLFAAVIGLAILLLLLGRIFNPTRGNPVKRMPYESGMDPIHDTRRRFDVRFHLVAIAFLVFDVELLFLYPWAVAVRQPTGAAASAVTAGALGSAPVPAAPEGAVAPPPLVRPVFIGGMLFLMLLTLGFVYDWRKGIFRWR